MKLAIAVLWLVGLAFTLHPVPPVVLAVVALVAGLTLGGIPPLALGRTLAPVWLAALAIGLSNMLFSAANGDPATATLIHVGPVRIAEEAVREWRLDHAAGGRDRVRRRGLRADDRPDPARRLARPAGPRAERVSRTARWPPTRRSRASPRTSPPCARPVASAACAAGWHPRLFVGLLVLAIRHADRMAVSMDARAFGSGAADPLPRAALVAARRRGGRGGSRDPRHRPRAGTVDSPPTAGGDSR